jgi:uncharacterized phage protein (TIGR02218 family)
MTEYFNPNYSDHYPFLSWCRACLITRLDGTIIAVTDFDQDFTYNSVTYLSTSGVAATATNQSHDLSVDSMELVSVISSLVTEPDLIQGRYDQARVEIFIYDWLNQSPVRTIFKGFLGGHTISYDKNGAQKFSIQAQSLDLRLQQKTNNIVTMLCPKVFGEIGPNKCNYDTTNVTGTGSIVYVEGNGRFNIDVASFTWPAGAPSGATGTNYFSFGKMTFTSGILSGITREIQFNSATEVSLASPFDYPPNIGDTFTMTPGCNKTKDSCMYYNNILNYRGFNELPGIDTLVQGASTVLQNTQSSTF